MISSSNSNNKLPESPRAVIDTCVFEVDMGESSVVKLPGHTQLENSVYESLRPPSVTASSVSSNSTSPPLKDLTLISSSLPSSSSSSSSSSQPGVADKDDDDNDASTVSSVSLDEDTNWDAATGKAGTPTKRCIFSSYWQAKGGRPQELLRPSSCYSTETVSASADKSCLDDDTAKVSSSLSSQELHGYEQLLVKSDAQSMQDSSTSSQDASVPSRRRLWDNRYVSQSSASLSEGMDLLLMSQQCCLRKIRSSEGVEGERKPSASCLKQQCRYSGSSRASTLSTSKDTIVSFSSNIQVKFVFKTEEQHAEEGWSKYFA